MEVDNQGRDDQTPHYYHRRCDFWKTHQIFFIDSKSLLPGLFIYQQRYETKIYDKRPVDAYDVSLLDLDAEGRGSLYSLKTVENSEEISGKKNEFSFMNLM